MSGSRSYGQPREQIVSTFGMAQRTSPASRGIIRGGVAIHLEAAPDPNPGPGKLALTFAFTASQVLPYHGYLVPLLALQVTTVRLPKQASHLLSMAGCAAASTFRWGREPLGGAERRSLQKKVGFGELE